MDVDPEIRDRFKEGRSVCIILSQRKIRRENQRKMRRMSKSLTGVAKATVSRSKGRAVASSQWYSTVPDPPKDEDLEEEEDGKEEEVEKEDEWSLKGKRFIAFPESIGGGFLVDEKKETKNSSGGATSSFGQGTHRNYDQGTGKPDYGGGCSGCHGCSRCPECNGGCRYRSGGSN